jgi:hypothetical protein
MERIEPQPSRTSSPFVSLLPIPIQAPKPHYPHTTTDTSNLPPSKPTPINVQISPSHPTHITITITVPLRTSPDTYAQSAGGIGFGLGLLCTTGVHDMHDPIDDSSIPGFWCRGQGFLTGLDWTGLTRGWIWIWICDWTGGLMVVMDTG